MIAKEFIKNKINDIVSLFDGIKIKYTYDTMSEYHIVEVSPEDIRRGNSDYKKAEMQLWMGFIYKFPDENLLICAPSETNESQTI